MAGAAADVPAWATNSGTVFAWGTRAATTGGGVGADAALPAGVPAAGLVTTRGGCCPLTGTGGRTTTVLLGAVPEGLGRAGAAVAGLLPGTAGVRVPPAGATAMTRGGVCPDVGRVPDADWLRVGVAAGLPAAPVRELPVAPVAGVPDTRAGGRTTTTLGALACDGVPLAEREEPVFCPAPLRPAVFRAAGRGAEGTVEG